MDDATTPLWWEQQCSKFAPVEQSIHHMVDHAQLQRLLCCGVPVSRHAAPLWRVLIILLIGGSGVQMLVLAALAALAGSVEHP